MDRLRASAIEPPFDQLSPEFQVLQRWAQAQASLAATEQNERTWSPEYFARWHDQPEAAQLGSLPVFVLTGSRRVFRDLDISAQQQQAEWRENQRRLATLSENSAYTTIACGEHIEIESPERDRSGDSTSTNKSSGKFAGIGSPEQAVISELREEWRASPEIFDLHVRGACHRRIAREWSGRVDLYCAVTHE